MLLRCFSDVSLFLCFSVAVGGQDAWANGGAEENGEGCARLECEDHRTRGEAQSESQEPIEKGLESVLRIGFYHALGIS